MNEYRDEQYSRAAKLNALRTIESCFDGKIRATDIDGIANVAGCAYSIHVAKPRDHFLFFEAKTIGGEVPKAQQWFYSGLFNHLKAYQTLIVWEHDRVEVPFVNIADVKSIQIATWRDGIKWTCKIECGIDVLKYWCCEWMSHAREKPNTFVSYFDYAAGIQPGLKGSEFSKAGL